LVLTAYNRFEYTDVPDPQPGADDVLLRVKACGICGSDVHGMDGSTGRRKPPIIMGHEAAGVVAEAGANVSEWKQGDRVTFDSTVYCGRCWFCRRGRINLCEDRRVLGVSCDEYHRDGAFAEFLVVPQRILYRLPDRVTFEQAAMTEALSIAVHAVSRAACAPGDTAVVVGTGVIGLLIVQALRATGCREVIAVDLDPAKLKRAQELGACAGLAADGDVAAEVAARTEGRGADVVFEAVGVTASVRTAVACVRKGGSLTLVGNLSPDVDWPLQSVVTREISVNGSCASCGEYPTCLDLIASGRVNVNALISATAPLAEGASWFRRLYDKEPSLMKVILCP